MNSNISNKRFNKNLHRIKFNDCNNNFSKSKYNNAKKFKTFTNSDQQIYSFGKESKFEETTATFNNGSNNRGDPKHNSLNKKGLIRHSMPNSNDTYGIQTKANILQKNDLQDPNNAYGFSSKSRDKKEYNQFRTSSFKHNSPMMIPVKLQYPNKDLEQKISTGQRNLSIDNSEMQVRFKTESLGNIPTESSFKKNFHRDLIKNEAKDSGTTSSI